MAGFPGKHYCPRMATMNKPTFRAILNHAPHSPSLVFVASRRQTRLTALDLISYLSSDEASRALRPDVAQSSFAVSEPSWLRLSEAELEPLLAEVRDPALSHTLRFGVGIHHAGLVEKVR